MADLGAIVKQLEPELGVAAGPPVPLAGGITNRNYRIRFGERECVLRVPGRDTSLLGIDREAERLACAEAARLGIGPELVAAGEGYLVSEYLDAEPIAGERLRAEPESAARALRAFHESGLQLPARFWVPELLDDYRRIVLQRGGTLPAAYRDAQTLAGKIAAALPLEHPVPCHDDLLPANILALHSAPGHALLVDWEYAGMGHFMFDLGNLAINNEFENHSFSEDRLLHAYFGEPPSDGRRAALALMRIMSDAREAAWGVVQGAISELEFDFADYADQHFARLEQSASDPRLQEWLDAASA
jgi:thiamine kinase-like enzyme